MDHPEHLQVGLVGFGEVGRILGGALVARGVRSVVAWDLLLADPAAAPAMREAAVRLGVEPATSLAALLARADLVISAVTASNALAVARESAGAIRPGTWFVDLNSASPGTKSEAARIVDAAGGRYVESAVMTSVPPYGIRVPMLLGGPHAGTAQALLATLGFSADVASMEIGVASAIKMCRSVFIKGLEAIVVESFTTARAYGVEAHVLASLQETFPTIDWEQQGAYLFSRVAMHGKRRAEEMREAAVTVREAGLDGFMAAATADRQDWVAQRKASAGLADLGKDAGWRAYADRLIAGAPGTAGPKSR